MRSRLGLHTIIERIDSIESDLVKLSNVIDEDAC